MDIDGSSAVSGCRLKRLIEGEAETETPHV